MSIAFASRLRGALGVLVISAVASLATPVLSPALASDNLSANALQSMVDSGSVLSALAESPDGRVPVIVEFVVPEVSSLSAMSAQSDSAAADAALTAAVHSAQSAILGRVLELPEMGALSTAMESEALNIKRMDFSPMFAITADADLLERLAADPEVARIHLDGVDDPMMRTSLPLIGMPAAFAAGATGNNWRVAVLDTGGRRSHEFLNRQIVSAACYSTTNAASGSTSICPGGVSASTSISSADDCDRATIFGCGHGTHVAGTAAGFNLNPNGTNPDYGVARDARIISINVFSQFSRSNCGSLSTQYTGGCVRAFNSDQVLGLERVYALRNSMNIAAVNMSLGGGQNFSACDSDIRKPIIDQLRAAGIATIIAAGNDGFSTSISTPACISSAIAVASSTSTDQRSSFSNWSNLIGLVAPGSDIVSSYLSGNSNNYYQSLNGTSMATPHVAGAFAALRSAVPDASVSQILAALQNTGTGITVSGVTRSRINVDLALASLRGANATTTTLTGPTASTSGNSVTFTATVSPSGGGTPTGTVTFRRDGASIGTQSLSSGTASFTTSALPVGTHQITAIYGGSATHSGSSSAVLTHTVTGVAPANDNFANAAVVGAPGTFTGSNIGATAEPGEPTHATSNGTRNSVWWRYTPSASGQVTIDTFGSNFDTVLAVYTGSAVNALTPVAANDDSGGGYQSRVQFDAQAGVRYNIAVAGYGTSTGSIMLTIAGGGGSGATPTTTSLTGPSSSDLGQSVTFTATVSAASGTPSGTVTFRRGATTIGTASLSSGSASITTASLPLGSHQITASYGGSGTHLASMSSALTHVVAGDSADVVVNLSVPAGIVRPGSPARLVADVASASAGAGTPSGTVRFSANGTTVGSATLSSGRATLSTALPTGSNTVIAHFLGTATHNPGQSSPQTVEVTAVMGGEIMVNQRTSHNQRRPSITALGRTAVVVYEDQLVANGPFGVTAQRVNWAGVPNVEPIEVAPPAAGTGFPHVAEMASGSFVVVWEAEGRGGRQDVFMRRFRGNGRAVDGIPRPVNDSGQGNQTMPRVAGLEDGGYAVVWQSDRADGDGDGIVLRIFESSGLPRTGEIVVNRTTAGDQRAPDVAVQQGGDIVVSWAGQSSGVYGAYAQRVSVQGTLLGGEILVGRSGSTFQPQVRIAALDNGNFALAFEESERLHQSGPFRAIVQRLRQRGPLWGDPVAMEQVMTGDQRTPAITGLRRMALATAWRAPDGGLNGVWVQTVGRDGVAFGAPERANETVPGNQFEPGVARVGLTRNYFVVWTASGVAPGDGTNIVIRRFMGP